MNVYARAVGTLRCFLVTNKKGGYAPVSGSPIRGPSASSGSTKYSISRLAHDFTIAVAMGLRDDHELHRPLRPVEHLVRYTGIDLQAIAGLKLILDSIGLEYCNTGENQEKLAGPTMTMAHFGRARRHALADDAQLGVLDEVPPVAPLAPEVVLSRVQRDLTNTGRIVVHASLFSFPLDRQHSTKQR